MLLKTRHQIYYDPFLSKKNTTIIRNIFELTAIEVEQSMFYNISYKILLQTEYQHTTNIIEK
jgi:hypothetical protein